MPQSDNNHNFKSLDDQIEATLLAQRRLYFADDFSAESCGAFIRKLWYLELSAPGKPILFVISSPGGWVDGGLAMWDQIKMITSPVTTLITGLAASMGSVLGLCASPGRRFATPHARIMIHQPAIHGVIRGQASDLEIQAKEIIKTRKLLVDLYVTATKQDRASVEKALDRDTWMSAEEALKFGLIDGIISNFSELAM